MRKLRLFSPTAPHKRQTSFTRFRENEVCLVSWSFTVKMLLLAYESVRLLLLLFDFRNTFCFNFFNQEL